MKLMLWPTRACWNSTLAALALGWGCNIAVAAATVPDAEGIPSDRLSEADLQQINAALQADAQLQQPDAGAPAWPSAVGAFLQSMNPDISLLLDMALAAFNTDTPLQLGGHDPSTTGFTLQQLELHMGAFSDPYLRLDGNVVFTADGVEIEEAFATTTSLVGNLQLRAGQFLTRFGRQNPVHPHQWQFVDQPLVLGKFFGGDGNRGLGAEVAWLSILPWYLELVVSANNASGDCCARSYFPDATTYEVHRPSDLLWTGAMKQFFDLHSDVALLWGLSVQTAPNAQEGRTAIYGTDIYLRYRPLAASSRQALSLQAEIMLRDRYADHERVRDYGGYVQVVWNINPTWEIGSRGELVSGVAQDSLDPMWTGARSRYAAQVTYYPSHFSRLRLQGTAGRAAWRETPIVGAFLALEVMTGAHGAHSY